MFKTLIVAISTVLLLSGCSRTIEYYEYSPEEVSVESYGIISVGLLGEFVKDNNFFEKKTIKGNPYSLSISFVPSSNAIFCIKKLLLSQGGAEREVKLVGDKCGRETDPKDFDPGTKLYLFEKVGDIRLGKPVRVTVKGVIGSGDLKEVDVELKVKYRTERRNILLDRFLSV